MLYNHFKIMTKAFVFGFPRLFGKRCRYTLKSFSNETMEKNHQQNIGEIQLPQPVLKDGRFQNPWEGGSRPSFLDFQLSLWKSKEKPQVPIKKDLDDEDLMRIQEVDAAKLNNPPINDGLQVTWLGHATYLVQFVLGTTGESSTNIINVLFDPVFSEKIGPVHMIGQSRYRTCPVKRASELPRIDVVCLSHDHYDHCDVPTIRDLHLEFPSIKWCVPLRTDQWLRTVIDDPDVSALTWWETMTLDLACTRGTTHSTTTSSDDHQSKLSKNKNSNPDQDNNDKSSGESKRPQNQLLVVEFVPAQHWCLRGMSWGKIGSLFYPLPQKDENQRLWGGWVLKTSPSPTTEGKSVYHAGDTGYCDVFKTIGERHGGFDISMLPIGAYTPRETLAFQHVNPEEAVQIHKDVRSKKSFAMHWGTFTLTNENYKEPASRLKKCLHQEGLKENEFLVLKHGETVVVE